MNEILSVGLILMSALVAGHLAQLARAPEVIGYLLVGLAIGPTALDLVSHRDVETLGFLSEVTLGVILFSIGSIFEAGTFRKVGRQVVRITLFEAFGAFLLVSAGLLVVGQPLPVAVLLGVVAMETAPATTLMILHEYDARGPMTDRLLALIALNNMLVLVAYGLVAAGLTLALGEGAFLAALWRAGHGLVWSTAGSVALGILVGLLIDLWAARARESGEGIILTMGAVLVVVGAARALHLSPLFATLALGATVANTSHHGERLLKGLGQVDPPLYAAFFVLAGAQLELGRLGTLGLAGLLYVVLRTIGKVVGASLGIRGQDVPEQVRRNLGFCLISSSSLAVGLSLQVRASFPDLAPPVTAVALSAVIVFEIAGPLLARRALFAAGEAKTTPRPLEELPEEVAG